jgi:hypothetical protein
MAFYQSKDKFPIIHGIIKLKHLEIWLSEGDKSKERNGQEHQELNSQQFGTSMGPWKKMIG